MTICILQTCMELWVRSHETTVQYMLAFTALELALLAGILLGIRYDCERGS